MTQTLKLDNPRPSQGLRPGAAEAVRDGGDIKALGKEEAEEGGGVVEGGVAGPRAALPEGRRVEGGQGVALPPARACAPEDASSNALEGKKGN